MTLEVEEWVPEAQILFFSFCMYLKFLIVKVFKNKAYIWERWRIPKVLGIPVPQIFISKLGVQAGMGQWNHKSARKTPEFEMRKEITGYPFNGMLRPPGISRSYGDQSLSLTILFFSSEESEINLQKSATKIIFVHTVQVRCVQWNVIDYCSVDRFNCEFSSTFLYIICGSFEFSSEMATIILSYFIN